MPRVTDLIAPSFYGVWRSMRRFEAPEYWLAGGRGSGKSSMLSIRLVAGLVEDPVANAVVFRKVAADIRDSVFAQVLWAVRALGLEGWFRATVSPHMVEYLPTGQRILFRGLDDSRKTKSLKIRDGYLRFIWFEELDQFAGPAEVEEAVLSAMRGGETFQVLASYNPPESAANWVNAEAARPKPGRIVHLSDYRSVPAAWLGAPFIRRAEEVARSRPRVYRHVYLGEPTGTGAEVFTNLRPEKITAEKIAGFRLRYHGLDFGFESDPSALVSCGYDTDSETLYVYGEWVAHGAFCDGIWRDGIAARGLAREQIIADSADPRSIAELRRLGAAVSPCRKGRDSVRNGLLWLRRRAAVVIDPARCPRAWEEFTRYEYRRTPRGDLTGDYPDRDNHTIDAIRYACQTLVDAAAGSRFL